jgi:hypothetical protein
MSFSCCFDSTFIPFFAAKPTGLIPPTMPAWETQYRRHIGRALKTLSPNMRQRLASIVAMADNDLKTAGLEGAGLVSRAMQPVASMVKMPHVAEAAALAKENPRVAAIFRILRGLYTSRAQRAASEPSGGPMSFVTIGKLAETQARLNVIGDEIRKAVKLDTVA